MRSPTSPSGHWYRHILSPLPVSSHKTAFQPLFFACELMGRGLGRGADSSGRSAPSPYPVPMNLPNKWLFEAIAIAASSSGERGRNELCRYQCPGEVNRSAGQVDN